MGARADKGAREGVILTGESRGQGRVSGDEPAGSGAHAAVTGLLTLSALRHRSLDDPLISRSDSTIASVAASPASPPLPPAGARAPGAAGAARAACCCCWKRTHVR